MPLKFTHTNSPRTLASILAALAISLTPIARAYVPGDPLENEYKPRPTVEQACGNGRVGFTQMFAGATAVDCDLVGSFDHFECWGTGGRYTHTSFVYIRTADCNPNPNLFNG